MDVTVCKMHVQVQWLVNWHASKQCSMNGIVCVYMQVHKSKPWVVAISNS
jgi:hypothetical protein